MSVASPDDNGSSFVRRELPLVNGDGVSNDGTEAAPLVVAPEYRPRKSLEVLELDMGDGVILYNHAADLVHHLNPSAAIVWQICDGEATIEHLAAEIAGEYGRDADEVQGQLTTLIAELETLGLVEDARTDAPTRADAEPA
jgi:PqqD family protein of HPr-rel-A system